MIEQLYSLYSGVCDYEVSIDSREARGIFFALKGENHDGNDYALKALGSGAKYAVVVNRAGLDSNDDRFIVVDDTLRVLQGLAAHHRMVALGEILAITGTNGKTTTKELLTLTLSARYNVGNTKGNLNNHIGVPLTLLSFRPDTHIGIVEMGANHIGEIAHLCKIAKPNKGIITNVGYAHLEGFGGFEGVKQAKGELYDYLASSYGVAIHSRYDKELSDMAKARVMNVYAYEQPLTIVDGTREENTNTLSYIYKDDVYNTHLVGAYNLHNIIATVSVASLYGMRYEDSLLCIAQYEPTNNRSQMINTGNDNKIILDAYNANLSSVEVALDNFANLDVENKLVILGQMNELGSYSAEAHTTVVSMVNKLGVKALYVGKEYLDLDKQLFNKEDSVFATTEELLSYLQDTPISSHLILIKGSRSFRLEELVVAL